VWDKLRKQIEVERQQLHLLIDTHRPLLVKCSSGVPDGIECSALAAMLHSFYNGVENVFKRVAIGIDGALPSGATWHVDLLEGMTSATAARSGVISPALCDRLREYLNFRHFFRQAYTFQLRWDKMATLVLQCDATLQDLETELAQFLQSGGDAGKAP
jgi:hypothetical protein